MRRLLFIYNPAAGRLKYASTEKIIRHYFEPLTAEYAITWHDVSHHTPFENVSPHDFDIIFAVGGDGTVKEVASWIIANNAQTPLAIIPSGSGNVMAFALGIPFSIRKALDFNLSHAAQKTDIGIVNNRHIFLLAAGCGLDAYMIKHTPKNLKRLVGVFAYAVGLMRSFFSIKPKKVFVKIDNESKIISPHSIVISNIGKFLTFTVNPYTKFNDGFLNVSIFNPMRLIDFVKVLWRMFQGRYDRDWRYQYYRATSVYVLPMRGKIPMQIDGELISLPYLDIRILPNKLSIICDTLE